MTDATPPGAVLVMGAGSVGCWLGGSLAAAGVPVIWVGRPRVLAALRAHGLTLTALDAPRRHLAPATLDLHERVPGGATPALVLLCVKSGATAEAAAELAARLPGGTLVVSMQNGIGNVRTALRAAPTFGVLPGMVPFNIAEVGPGHFHRGTLGQLAAEDHPALRRWAGWFERAGLGLKLHADLESVQWGKLLINLNNPVNALSGLPLRDELLERGYRRIFARLQREALAVLRAARIEPARMTALKPQRLPVLLSLPTPVFRLVAARMLRIDEKARSSMADDLALGRPTEVDALCGEVVRLAAAHGLEAPANRRIAELVQAWPERRRPWPAAELARALRR